MNVTCSFSSFKNCRSSFSSSSAVNNSEQCQMLERMMGKQWQHVRVNKLQCSYVWCWQNSCDATDLLRSSSPRDFLLLKVKGDGPANVCRAMYFKTFSLAKLTECIFSYRWTNSTIERSILSDQLLFYSALSTSVLRNITLLRLVRSESYTSKKG